MKRAIVMDRDGTLCEDAGYLTRVNALQLVNQGARAVRRAREAGFLAVVATNQSGVARGLFPRERVERAHERLRALLAREGAVLDGIYYCPHHPQAGPDPRECNCRKPHPGMLLQAAHELELDLGASYMIGDRFRDLEAGRRAGATPILVLTGQGREEVEYHSDDRVAATHVAPDLAGAVQWILQRDTGVENR